MTENWIDITEFAQKYRISQSTIRRRIRCKTIPFKMERGKYLLQDSQDAMRAAPLFSRQSLPSQHVSQSLGMESDFSDIVTENIRLQSETKHLRIQVEELETLVKALEAQLELG
jgi:hypothetical protein